MSSIYSDLLDSTGASEFADDPLPGWAGPALLFGGGGAQTKKTDGEETADRVLVAGVPFDGTASSRPGAAEGPQAIRKASLVFSSYLNSLGSHDMLDIRTGETFRYMTATVEDVGDLHVYQSDTVKTFRAVASEVEQLVRRGDHLILLGGDHSISFPTFAGWQRAMGATLRRERLGYLQIDHHFDFGTHSAIHGPLYHGANARRISELPHMSLARMAFFGVGCTTRKEQYEGLVRAGAQIVSGVEIRRQGVKNALAPSLAHLARHCDAVYVSIDIDVLDASVAPGTGNVTIAGLDAGELFDMVKECHSLNVRALDVVEVAPRYDSTGRTAQIAAQLLFEHLCRRPPKGST